MNNVLITLNMTKDLIIMSKRMMRFWSEELNQNVEVDVSSAMCDDGVFVDLLESNRLMRIQINKIKMHNEKVKHRNHIMNRIMKLTKKCKVRYEENSSWCKVMCPAHLICDETKIKIIDDGVEIPEWVREHPDFIGNKE